MKYENETGSDLFHGCIVDLADKISKFMDITGTVRRMDSTMIESNIRILRYDA